MSDLISRQAAIDALADMHCKSDEDGYVWIIRSDAWARMDALPSAQPEPCEDAVSRKAVYDAMVEKGQRSRRYKLGESWELNGTEIREALDTMPSAQPEIIRCKECLWRVGRDCTRFTDLPVCMDDYCGKAKRRG